MKYYSSREASKILGSPKNNQSGDFPPLSFNDFEISYKILTEKLQPLVFELGFLRA
jgi:hypothetical protein